MRVLLFLVILVSYPTDSVAQVNTELRMTSDTFISPSFESTQQTNFMLLGGSLRTSPNSENPLKLDVEVVFSARNSLLNSFNVNEMYFDRGERSPWGNLYIGRKRSDWSHLDQRWNFGLWEPLYRWNPLAPERQGLTGFFWEVSEESEANGALAEVFYSPLFIPDHGASYDIQEGHFVQGHPWFNRPPETIEVSGKQVPIRYQIQTPKMSKVISQQTFSIRLQKKLNHHRFQASFARKPINNLALGYKGKLDVSNGLDAALDIMPGVYYHNLYGLDYISPSLQPRVPVQFGLSALFDEPLREENKFPEPWTYPVYEKAIIVSPFIKGRLGPHLEIQIQYITVQGGGVSEVGLRASPERQSLSTRYRFKEGVQLSTKIENLGYKNWHNEIAYFEGKLDQFKMLTLVSTCDLNKKLRVFGEAQLLDAEKEASLNDINEFGDNDRVIMGVSYVF